MRYEILPLHSALVRSYLGFCIQFWIHQYRRDMDIKKRAQSRVIKVVKGLRHLSPAKRLRELALLVPENTKEGFYWYIQILEGKVHRGQRQALFNALQRQEQGQQAQTETQKVPCELPYCGSDQVTGTAFPERLWSFQCWRHLKAIWTWSRAAWLRWHYLNWGLHKMTLGSLQVLTTLGDSGSHSKAKPAAAGEGRDNQIWGPDVQVVSPLHDPWASHT